MNECVKLSIDDQAISWLFINMVMSLEAMIIYLPIKQLTSFRLCCFFDFEVESLFVLKVCVLRSSQCRVSCSKWTLKTMRPSVSRVM